MNGSEWLCLWYLRLNGYFTLPNFIAHGGLTEVDVLAVRFPYSSEGFQDDARLEITGGHPEKDIVLAEAKRSHIDKLNRSWNSPEMGALNYVLRRVGIVPEGEVDGLARELYEKRNARVGGISVRIFCFGQSISKDLLAKGVKFISWREVFEFINQRFRENEKIKADHDAWDDFGKYLWQELSANIPGADAFFAGWERRDRVPPNA